MLQLGARYYWPELGRFVSQDPIRDGINWYEYANNDPLLRIDPRGTQAECCAAGCGEKYGKCMNRAAEHNRKCLSDCNVSGLWTGFALTLVCGTAALATKNACVGAGCELVGLAVILAIWSNCMDGCKKDFEREKRACEKILAVCEAAGHGKPGNQ